MSTPNDGGSAFPNIVHGAIADYQVCEGGMSLRDWFAGQVLPAMALGISQTHVENMRRGIASAKVDAESERALGVLASSAYRLADNMIAERAKAKP